MPLQKGYYSTKLYPLQDIVLTAVGACNTDFYLTGGTALSRWYLHHRFSDDLDFFVNDAIDFSDQVHRALEAIQRAGIEMDIAKRAEDFVRIQCRTSDVDLKIDFVNDIPYHSGTVQSFDLYPRVDGWWNILSNKICALERREPKDIADILFLCRAYSFAWEEVFHEAIQKTTYIDPLDISVIVTEFPKDFLSRVQWIEEISPDDAYREIQIIAKDILQKNKNSLARA